MLLSIFSRARRLSDEQKRAIVQETEKPGASVAYVCRRHGVATSMVFRWRVDFGLGARKALQLVTVALADGAANELPALAVLRDLVRPPDGMMAIEVGDGRRVFAPADSSPVEPAARQQGEGIMIVISAGVKVHLALGHTDMRGLDGLATLIQEHLKKDPCGIEHAGYA